MAIALVDAPLQSLGVGHEQVVAHDLDAVAEGVGEQLPAVPVVLGAAVLDRDDRVLVDPALEQCDHAGRVDGLAVDRVGLLLLVEQFRGRDVQRDEGLLAGFVAGLGDRFHDQVQRLGVAAQVGSESAFVTRRPC